MKCDDAWHENYSDVSIDEIFDKNMSHLQVNTLQIMRYQHAGQVLA